MVLSGEDQAWELLSELDHNKVELNAGATFDCKLSSYVLKCFGQDVSVSLRSRKISGSSHIGESLVENMGELLRLSILRYLIHAKDILFSGQLVRPSDLAGGAIYLKGSHVLPLDKLAGLFNNSREDFLRKGKILGGTQLDYGNVSLKLFPFPKFQIVLIVWSGDEEFPPHSSLLLDSGGATDMPADIIWSTATMTVRMMLL